MLRNGSPTFGPAPRAQCQDDHGRCGTSIAPARWSGDAPQCLRGLPRRPDSRRQRQFRYRAPHEKREADILRLGARPSGRRNKKPSLRKRRDGIIRGATLIEGAKRLPLKTVNAGQTYRTTASTRVPPVCRRVSVPPVPLAAPFQPRGASLSRHRWEFPVDHALLFL